MKRHRLLVVDDEPEIAKFVKHVAEAGGFGVLAADTPRNAVDVVRMWRPDVICLDLVMPGVDGIELLTRFAESGCRAKVILMSAMDLKVIDSAQRVGTNHGLDMLGRLQKPVSVEDLETLLGRAVGRPPRPAMSTEALRGAVDNDGIEIRYQPRVGIGSERTGDIDGVEALPRLRHPTQGGISAREFVPLAKQNGLTGAITWSVLKAGVSQLRQWQDQGHRLDLSINLSPHLLGDHKLPDRLTQLCSRYDIEPARISLEINESVAMQDAALTTALLTRFRLKGFCISMDDFGTGVSSLVQLYRMPFTEIKVGRSFVTGMKPGSEAEVIVRSIAELGRSLGLRVCAQGVDSEYALRVLRSAGCSRAQGDLFSKPVAASELTALLRVWNRFPGRAAQSA